MPDLEKLQERVYSWSLENFGDQPAENCLLGVVEELGELAHADLKERQGIRVDEDHTANAKDAIGDVIIYLLDYCARRGWDLSEIIDETAGEVLERDWNEYPANGVGNDD